MEIFIYLIIFMFVYIVVDALFSLIGVTISITWFFIKFIFKLFVVYIIFKCIF